MPFCAFQMWNAMKKNIKVNYQPVVPTILIVFEKLLLSLFVYFFHKLSLLEAVLQVAALPLFPLPP